MLLISIGLFLTPFAFLDKVFDKRFKKVFLFILSGLFIILGGVRWNTGTDWDAYYYGFQGTETYQGATGEFSFEWGFSMLNYFVNKIGGDYTIFLLLFTFIKVLLKYKVLINENFIRYSLFSWFLYYCYSFGDIVTTRQALAVSITFYSTLFLIKNEKYIFFIFVICAALIHKSAIIFGLAYFIYNAKLSKKQLLIIFLSSMMIGLAMFQFQLSSIFQSIPILNKLTSFQDKISVYSETGQVTYGGIDSLTTIVLGYIKKVFVVLPILLNFKVFQNNTKIRGLLNVLVFGCVVYFVLGSISSEFKRINSYFEIYEIVLIPYLIYNVRIGRLKTFLITLYILYAISRLYSGLQMFWDLYDPFYTIFDLHNYRMMK